MTLALIGSRRFDDYDLLCRAVREHFPGATRIVSGGAHGADELAARWASEHGREIREILPEWRVHGRGAGQIRNRAIIDEADAVLAFWDGESRGTAGALTYARKRGKAVVVVRFGPAATAGHTP